MMVQSAAVLMFFFTSVFISNASIIQFNKNVEYVDSFKCSSPRPKIQTSLEIFRGFINGETLGDLDILVPAYTVLYICDEDCGICPPRQKCVADAASMQEVTFEYRIMNKKNQVKRYGHGVFQNATHCMCKPIEK